MERKQKQWLLASVSLFVLLLYLLSGFGIEKAVAVIAGNLSDQRRTTVIVDAGHGGVDGGATSCTGVLESMINLEIALKLNDLMHLLGVRTIMIRTTDQSIYTQGDSIAQKKVSDLKERVRIINGTDQAVLVSIHQNHFPDSRYKGAQVFYAKTNDSQVFAQNMQDTLISALNKGSTRSIKRANNIYLMEKITCPGILIECGFLSNPEEEAQLRNEDYQKKLCCVIASVTSKYLYTESTLS